MQGRKIYEEKQKLSKLLLKPYFARYPELVRKYSDAQQHVDESNSDSEQNPRQNVGGSSEESKAGSSKQQNFDLKDRYDFPSFQPQEQNQPGKKIPKKLDTTGTGSKWEPRQNVINPTTEEEKGQLEEQFPSLIKKYVKAAEQSDPKQAEGIDQELKALQEEQRAIQVAIEKEQEEALQKKGSKQIGYKKGKKGQKMILLEGNFK